MKFDVSRYLKTNSDTAFVVEAKGSFMLDEGWGRGSSGHNENVIVRFNRYCSKVNVYTEKNNP